MPKNKKKEETSDSDSGPEDRNPVKKVKADGSADSKVGKGKWELDRNRFVSISEFKGRKSVDIREFYMDKSSNEMKPGKKGISLSKSEWEKLQKLIPEINNEF